MLTFRFYKANVAYFTASRLAPSKPAIQPTKPKPTGASVANLPALATPRELAAAASRAPGAKAQRDEEDGGPITPALESQTVHAGQKRPAEEASSPKQTNNAVHPRSTEDQGQKPRPKKQKQAPSLFIPKKVRSSICARQLPETEQYTETRAVERRSWAIS